MGRLGLTPDRAKGRTEPAALASASLRFLGMTAPRLASQWNQLGKADR